MQIKVSGLKEVEAQLRKLGSKDGTRVLRAAMLRATKPIEDQAKSNAAAISEGSGALSLAIGRRFLIGRQKTFGPLPDMGGRFTVSIGPIKKSRTAIALYNLFYGRKRKGIFHGHFSEFGTKRSRKQPFLKPALDAKGPQAVSILAAEIRKGIDSLLRRRAK
jgi:HK97 gp10 family phage protein